MSESSVPHRTHYLAPPLTRLIGREAERSDVAGLLRDADARLVTLTGPGGIGKTRLALAVTGELRESFTDGVWFIPLASIADSLLVIPTIARSLGLIENRDQPFVRMLTDYLQDRLVLLVLDNVEHVIDAASDIAHLLNACPSLHVLATSREPLHVYGEHQYPVPSLSVPSVNGETFDHSMQENDAVKLFMERAREALPSFRLTESNAPLIVEVCRRLDGIPLALELAAAHLKILSPNELLGRMDYSLGMLTGGQRDMPLRQQTMRDTLRWSNDLLSVDEQRSFRALSVFAGGCTLSAAGAVLDNNRAFDVLSSLVDKCLLQRIDQDAGVARYGMLEPVRQFAYEQLTEAGYEVAHVHQLHATFFVGLAEDLHAHHDGRDGPAHYARMMIEHDNVRAALRWLRENNDIDQGLRLVGHLGIFWHQTGFISEGKAYAESFMNAPIAPLRTLDRAHALWTTSWLWICQGETETAMKMVEESCAIAEEHDHGYLLARALFVRGVCYFRSGNPERAGLDWDHALELFRMHDDDPAMAVRVLLHLGVRARHAGDLQRSRVIIEETLSLARNAGLTMIIGPALGALALIEERSGNDKRAAELYRERLVLYQSFKIPRGVAETLEYIGCLLHRRGLLELAVSLLGLASVFRERSGMNLYLLMDELDLEKERNELRNALGESRFLELWAEGMNMRVDDVIELVTQPTAAASDTPSAEETAGLTPRETEVLRLIAANRSNREIAAALFISRRTVERHIENLYRKLGIHSRIEAIDVGRRHLN